MEQDHVLQEGLASLLVACESAARHAHEAGVGDGLESAGQILTIFFAAMVEE